MSRRALIRGERRHLAEYWIQFRKAERDYNRVYRGRPGDPEGPKLPDHFIYESLTWFLDNFGPAQRGICGYCKGRGSVSHFNGCCTANDNCMEAMAYEKDCYETEMDARFGYG